jgi:hypothetical protein
MAVDFEKFKGTLPYSAELFGVYQPILGWKSKRTLNHLKLEKAALIGAALKDISKQTIGRKELLRMPRPIGPDDLIANHGPSMLKTNAGKAVHDSAMRFFEQHRRAPQDAEWAQVVEDAHLDEVVEDAAEKERRRRGPQGGNDDPDTIGHRATAPAAKVAAPMITLKDEAIVAGTLTYIAQNQPQALSSLIQVGPALSMFLQGAIDPLAQFDPETQQAVLSPVGLINLYREYFFEFETFLGPPVEHVWVSPGGSLELFEIHTRRTTQEKQIEIATETITKSETEVGEEDELSTAIAEENAKNISLGVSASGNVDFGVVQASASASFGFETNTKSSEENAHKHARRQSEKISNEIRRNFKTTFKTTVETEDVSSRRYVLQNTTDKIVNYELRRKMRQVGVQVQHLGTQLCWQVYLDEPGGALGISSLVHVAQPDDLPPDVPPPDAPTKPADKKDQYVFVFPFEPIDEEAMDDGEDEDYVQGHDIEEDAGEGLINWTKDVTVTPPQGAAGYTLHSANIASVDRMDPDEDPPAVSADCSVVGDDVFRITLNQVNFNDQPGIRFTIDLVWKGPEISDEAKKAYETALEEYDEQKKRLAHATYVKAIRERINLASNIRMRPSSDLREEERTVIFRRLIKQLTGLDLEGGPHLSAELIRGIFDVEKMLYYVAPEWWLPRTHANKQQLGGSTAEHLTDQDKVTWGGSKAWGRPNYMITEESEPARMGTSLGWLLQLDGDPHRNAFLNSPWVKAVIPIRPGKERAALRWLKQAHVEGTSGLDADYGGSEDNLQGKSIEEALLTLADTVSGLGKDIDNVLATETVFEHGFDPLEEGFRATGEPFEIFDQWIEVLPTDQVVAVEYFAP